MSREHLARLARRTLVVAATGMVVAVGIVTVQLASDWRTAEAPLDAAPVGMTTIEDQAAVEAARAADLDAQMGDVAQQVSDLQSALTAANGAIDGDAANATKLQEQLASAKDRLTAMQKQLKAAQARLDALNRAAARQAALNQAAASSRHASGGHEDDHDDDHDDGGEHDRGDDD